jgi:hypothetical protein
MKNVLIVSVLLLSLNSFSQKIDSINVLSQNTPPVIHVFGELYHTGYSITDVNYQILDSIVLTLFFKECNGYQVVTEFDTVFSIMESWPMVTNDINILSILDTNTTDSNCFIVNQYDTLERNTFSTSILGVDNLLRQEKIKLCPNPVKESIKIEVSDNTEIESIELFDLGGKRVKTFNNSVGNLNISDLGSGTYFLRILTTKGGLAEKVIIE